MSVLAESAAGYLLTGGQVVTPGGIVEGCSVLVRDGRVHSLGTDVDAKGSDVLDLRGKYVLPGFIDTQVNGGGGVLFNDDPSVDTLRTMASAHAKFGTTALLPTLISDELEVVEQGLSAVRSAISQGVPGIIGIHIEGPFITESRKGVHDASKLQTFTRQALDRLEPLGNGPSILTVAPEQVPESMVQRLVEKGFIVCAGHSEASYEQVQTAINEGLSGFTHLFNAMSPLTSREPGMVGAALDHADTWCGIIADGHHVAEATVRIALRCKSADRLMLVSDAMPPVGTDLETFELQGVTVNVNEGICRDSNGTLAGTALDMAGAIRTMIRMTGCSLEDAAKMASTTPAAFLGLSGQRGSIAEGMVADLAILDETLHPVATMIGGILNPAS